MAPYTSRTSLLIERLQRKVEIMFREVRGAEEAEALALIRECHYQQGQARGRILAVHFTDEEAVSALGQQDAPSPGISPFLAGAAVVGIGCVRGKPKGRAHLANLHFPTLDLERTPRNKIVEIMGLAMINRVAVHATFRGLGIGAALALECRRFAGIRFDPPARFVEVMTTRGIDEAKQLFSGTTKDDFLQRAGFVLVRSYTGSHGADSATGPAESPQSDSTTGRRSSNRRPVDGRLFVPLAGEPFTWFQCGQKRWELRRYGRQYTERHVTTGRSVELRRGYRSDASLWGRINRVATADSVEKFFEMVPFREVIPIAASLQEAIAIANRILGTDGHARVLGFEVKILS